jgi:ParB family chromosome partitioning protein
LKLPLGVQKLVSEGRLTAGHARALIGRDDAEALARRIMEQNLTVRDVEALVQTLDKQGGRPATQRSKDKDADTKAFEKDLADALGLKVEIKRSSGESGMLTIRYGNFDQLEYLRTRLVGPTTGASGGEAS